jgi:hypothetical protein
MPTALSPTILPDYSETLDGVILDHYCPLPTGGTRVEEIAAMPTGAGNPGSDSDGQGAACQRGAGRTRGSAVKSSACPSGFVLAMAFAMP